MLPPAAAPDVAAAVALLRGHQELQPRIAPIGRGATGFAVPNATDADRARNRRIVITLARP